MYVSASCLFQVFGGGVAMGPAALVLHNFFNNVWVRCLVLTGGRAVAVVVVTVETRWQNGRIFQGKVECFKCVPRKNMRDVQPYRSYCRFFGSVHQSYPMNGTIVR